MFTYFAITFAVFLLAAILYGFGFVMRRPPGEGEVGKETCSLCLKKFEKSELVDREVGDYKLLYFCPQCVESLYSDVMSKKPGPA